MRKCAVGGQAVMEGVMMKSDEGIAMAVRRADGKIVTSYKKQRSKAQKGTFWGLPIVRGCVAFVESLSTGIKTTTDSANMYGEDMFADEEPTKFKKWLAKAFGKNIEDVVIGVAFVLGIALAIGLFLFLPQLISSLIFGEGKSLWRSLVEGVLRVGIYIGYLFACSSIKEMKRLFMYHGAEHKTIACYEAEDELTPENAMKHTRLHPRCGTNYLFLVMAISILVLTCIDVVMQYVLNFNIENNVLAFLFRFGIRIIFLPLIAGISYEVLRGAAKHDNWFTKIVRAPGMGLQLITTKEPTADMIEVAMAAFYIAMGERSCEYYNSKLNESEAEPEQGTEAEKDSDAEQVSAEVKE
ncbi:MAG: DUF1385 domain-containing protein [Christensenellaceae bacterium]|nr:DUF1385 domain-containing protein [Christensenellaceae bacterium]